MSCEIQINGLCKPAETLYRDYLGAIKHGNVFALDVGPNYEGKLRDIDVTSLCKIGAWIRDPSQAPQPPPPALSTGKPTIDELRVLPPRTPLSGIIRE